MTPSSTPSARERVARARAELLSPGADLSVVLRELEFAAEAARALGPNTPLPELEALRLELAGASKLASNGEAFWRGWGRLLGLEPSYTSGGVLASTPRRSSVEVSA